MLSVERCISKRIDELDGGPKVREAGNFEDVVQIGSFVFVAFVIFIVHRRYRKEVRKG